MKIDKMIGKTAITIKKDNVGSSTSRKLLNLSNKKSSRFNNTSRSGMKSPKKYMVDLMYTNSSENFDSNNPVLTQRVGSNY